MSAGRVFRFDGELPFVKISNGLYRGILDGRVHFVQGIQRDAADHGSDWYLIVPPFDTFGPFETKAETESEATWMAVERRAG